jgi:DNA-binding IclR family transcriptional regulator
MSAPAKDRYLINSILRACSILKSFSGENAHFKMSDLARRLQLDRSTAYRILLSLERAGFVEKNEEAGTYSLGLAAFEIGNAYLGRIDLIQVSKPIMADLAAQVQETVHLAVLSGLEIVYIDKVDSPRTLGVMSKLGQRGPLHCTSLGKSLLAFQPEEEQNRILHKIKMPPFTPKTITTKQKLIEELRAVKKQGYALDRREIEEDVECIGAPIFNYLGDVIAALSISGPRKKIGTPQEKRFIQSVVKAAALISSRMGYRPLSGGGIGK